MKTIYFKRAKNNSSLHPEFITEYISAEFLTDEMKKQYDDSMIEEHFLLELAKNEERHQQHLDKLRQEELASFSAQEAAQIAEKVEQKEAEREFERFKAWQRHSGKRK